MRRGATTLDPFLTRFIEVAKQVPSERARRALKAVLAEPERYHFQLLVTELNTTTHELTSHEYRVDQDYLYPASAIKTFASLAALMEFTSLSQQPELRWLSPKSALNFHGSRCERPAKRNLSSGLMTLEHELKQTQLVSSNLAFNHVFDVVGSERLHQLLSPLFPSLRLNHRLSSNETHEESLVIPPLSVCAWSKKEGVHHKKRRTLRATQVKVSDELIPALARPTDPFTGYGEDPRSLRVGEAYVHMKTKERVEEPMDFTRKNRVSFYDFQRLLFGIFDPQRLHQAFGRELTFKDLNIKPAWLNMLREAMITYPLASRDPKYSGASLSETRFKPLITGVRLSAKGAPKAKRALVEDHNLYYLNKAGKALGFHMDNALIGVGPKELKLNPKSHRPTNMRRALYVTVGLYVNQDQVLNDNEYEYKTISAPLFDAIGYAVGRYLMGELPER